MALPRVEGCRCYECRACFPPDAPAPRPARYDALHGLAVRMLKWMMLIGPRVPVDRAIEEHLVAPPKELERAEAWAEEALADRPDLEPGFVAGIASAYMIGHRYGVIETVERLVNYSSLGADGDATEPDPCVPKPDFCVPGPEHCDDATKEALDDAYLAGLFDGCRFAANTLDFPEKGIAAPQVIRELKRQLCLRLRKRMQKADTGDAVKKALKEHPEWQALSRKQLYSKLAQELDISVRHAQRKVLHPDVDD